MSEQARKVKKEAIPQWAEGLYYNKGLFSEVLVYHDDESLYVEVRGKESGVVRFSLEMLKTLGRVIEEEQQEEAQQESPESKQT
jgi:L-cysteine desulfidase